MVAKIQGTAVIEAVVRADGTVGDVRVVKSLDGADGLDNEGLAAVKRWLFRPATDANGKPVDVIVQIYLDFTLH
jgi:TonB family protein